MNHFPAVLLCVIVFILWIRYEIHKTRRQDENASKSFWESENEANFARKRDLSALNYIEIPLDKLPFNASSSDELLLAQERIKELSAKKIVNFTGISNTQLKLDYGAPNLDLLAEYDQNYTLLVRTLNQWANLLLKEGLDSQAEQVLEFAVSLRTDVSESYFNLGRIYKNEGHPEKISQLIKQAENLNTLSKKRIADGLTEILNQY